MNKLFVNKLAFPKQILAISPVIQKLLALAVAMAWYTQVLGLLQAMTDIRPPPMRDMELQFSNQQLFRQLCATVSTQGCTGAQQQSGATSPAVLACRCFGPEPRKGPKRVRKESGKGVRPRDTESAPESEKSPRGGFSGSFGTLFGLRPALSGAPARTPRETLSRLLLLSGVQGPMPPPLMMSSQNSALFWDLKTTLSRGVCHAGDKMKK